MTHLQERWEGVALPGDYLLERWVTGDDTAGYFETAGLADGRRALVKMVPESAPEAEAQFAIWKRTAELRHPHLRELLDCGRAELGDEIILYAIFEPADDTLASALAHGQLTEGEAREVLESMLSALRYLHSQGLCHPALYPDQVVAVGDGIKLSTEGLREISPDKPPTFTGDLRAFWYKISPCTLPRSADIFLQVVGSDPVSSPVSAHQAAPALAEIDDTFPGAAAVSPLPDTAMLPPPQRPSETPPVGVDGTRTAGQFPKWIIVGAAGVVLLILGLQLRRSPDSPVRTTPVTETSISPPATGSPAVAPKAAGKAPVKEAPKSASKSASKTGSNSASRSVQAEKIWRVIAFTYRSRAAAAHKAEQVNRSHPDLGATVFSTREKAGYYLVSLGGRMTRDDAIRIQRKARAERVSRDAYVQNYLE